MKNITEQTNPVPTPVESFMKKNFILRVRPLLDKIYGERDDVDLALLSEQLFAIVKNDLAESFDENPNKWDQSNILLITYGDSIRNLDEEAPLVTLEKFLTEHLQDTITGVHILPFFPYSSDDGFAVIDYLKVNPDLGDWKEVEKVGQSFDLMVDLVINHISSQSDWFQQFKQGIKPGCDYFIEVDPSEDVSSVVRPRSTPLLAEVDTPQGKKHVWATFSNDQIDLNFANPDVLLEFIKIILFYVQVGAKYIRLDAVGFLWKKLGSPCIHLEETHAAVKLIREIVQMIDASVAIITETNVPNRENLSYFGNRDEAHMIYNFTLPPLVIHALFYGRCDHLKTWMMGMPPAPQGCAYFNFMASHDGIGLRPAEGILPENERVIISELMKWYGGEISRKANSDGTQSLYEINVSLFEALKGTAKGEDQWQVERFLCSQTIMMSVEGIPAFYIHSLLATPNDEEGMKKTGQKRSINRHRWDLNRLETVLEDSDSPHFRVFQELRRLIKIRRRQGAFHPNATQYTLHLQPALFAFWRQSIPRDQSIFSIHNLSDRTQKVRLSDLNIIGTDPLFDLISQKRIDDLQGTFLLQAYQSAWLTNNPDSATSEDTSNFYL